MPTMIIKNGRVIDPQNNLDQVTDLVLKDGKIASVGTADSVERAAVIDAQGCIVTPGLIDIHVHFREPGQEDKETIATGAASAVAGGFTSVCCMPNTVPTLDDAGRIDFIYNQAAKANLCNVFPIGAITKGRQGNELAEIGLMAQAGAVGFSDDGCAVASAGVMAMALKYIQMTGKVVMQHCEDPELGGGVMNAGPLATKLGLKGWPRVAEELIIERDILLNRETSARYHVQHLSSAGSVEMIRRARETDWGKQYITAEASPHHLLLTDENCSTYDPMFKMNPPLRQQADIDAIKQGVQDGVITILATDHAPHTNEEKALEFASAPFGIIGLDCALTLYIKALILDGTIDWPQMIAMMTCNGAQLCNLHSKGHLTVGADADVTIIDPKMQWTIDKNQFASKSRNCPFDGWEVTGRAVTTIVGGDIKYNLEADRVK